MSETKSWSDLSPDILGRLLENLHLADQVRFRAVCKSWRVPEDRFKYSNGLLWIMNFVDYPDSWRFFDPHSQKSYKVTNSSDKLTREHQHPTVYASKHGWLLLGQKHSTIFLHNPFANEIIFLPVLPFRIFQATFTANPKSPDCEILVMSGPGINSTSYRYDLFLHRCSLSGDIQWSSQFCYRIPKSHMHLYGSREPIPVRSIHYMDGKLYCIVMSESLMCYDLADRSWRSRDTKLPKQLRDAVGLWLTQKGENLIIVCSRGGCLEFSVCDRSNMCLTNEANLNGTWFFISHGVILSAPSLDETWNEAEDGLRAFKIDYTCHDYYMRPKEIIEPYSRIEDVQLVYWPEMYFIEPLIRKINL